MTTTTADTMGQAVSVERLGRHLQWFAGVRRDTGGPGEDRAAEYIAAQCREAGVPVTVHEFDAYLSYPIRATLEVLAPEPLRIKCLTHSFGRSTGAQGLVTDLVYLEDGNVDRAAGRAALIDGLATPVTVLRASRAGCAAAIFANQDSFIHNMIATTIWGTPGIDQIDRLPQLPVVSVDREGGQALRRLLEGGRGVTLRIVTEVRTGWFRSRLPEVRIPGAEEPDRFVLVGGHSCAWEVGITDNATGGACLLELARILWAHRAGLARGVRICWWPGHSHGRYSGSTWYADTFFDDLAEGGLAYHNIDSPGVKGATRYVARHTTADVERFCQGVIERVTGQAKAPVHRPSRAADQSFLASGVPSFSTYPFLPDDHPDRRPWTGGCANAWWWHTEFDTLDKGDVDILALDTRVSLAAVLELCTAEVLPYEPARAAREVQDVVTDVADRVRGHLDLSRVVAEAAAYTAAAERLQAAAGEARGAPARAFNAAMIRLSRVVNPVVYSQGGRFQHDPAEWSPVMRATRQALLTGLAKAANLPGLAGQPEYGFLRAQAVREANRVLTALREARRLADAASGAAAAG